MTTWKWFSIVHVPVCEPASAPNTFLLALLAPHSHFTSPLTSLTLAMAKTDKKATKTKNVEAKPEKVAKAAKAPKAAPTDAAPMKAAKKSKVAATPATAPVVAHVRLAARLSSWIVY
jgi:hypothetical protein